MNEKSEELNGSGSGEERSREPTPYPVPHYMRTRRGLPRAIAFAVTGAWLLVLVTGTAALKRIETGKNTLSGSISEGTSFWSLQDRMSGACVGFGEVELFTGNVPPKKAAGKAKSEATDAAPAQPFLKAQGGFAVRFGEQTMLGTTSGRLDFDDILKLDTLEGSLVLGPSYLNVDSAVEDSEIHVRLHSGSIHIQQSFPRPIPIYAYRRDDAYSFRFPPQTEKLLGESLGSAATLPLELSRVTQLDYEQCKQNVLSRTAALHAIDLTGYLSLFKSHNHGSILHQLLQGLSRK